MSTQPTQQQSFFRSMMTALLVTLFLSVFSLFFLVRWIGGQAFYRGQELHGYFVSTAARSPLSIGWEIATGFLTVQPAEATQLRWLILGTDVVAGSGRQAVLTDTMLVATYSSASNTVSLLSLPRDLYHPEYATKINALYYYGQQQERARPEDFPEEVLSEMLGVSFDGVVVVSLQDVQELIDQVGGVVVDVPHTFTDEQFPRSNVDVTVETDPEILYETVTFEAGEQRMDGETALKYIRTRKSSDPEEGTDEARTRRQRQVLEALFGRLTDPYFVANPYEMGKLYRWYADRYPAAISLFDVGMVARYVGEARRIPELVSLEVPVSAAPTATSSTTLFIHPPIEKYGQWVFEPVDPTWEQLHQFVQENNL